MQGAIIETACAIAAESQDQSIDMGNMSLSNIIRDGQGRAKNFSIELVNCLLEHNKEKTKNWSHFFVSFDGEADGDFFSVHGEGSGIAIEITDLNGNVALPGQPLSQGKIGSGDMTLNYQLRLVANRKVLKAGVFFSTIRFKMDYL